MLWEALPFQSGPLGKLSPGPLSCYKTSSSSHGTREAMHRSLVDTSRSAQPCCSPHQGARLVSEALLDSLDHSIHELNSIPWPLSTLHGTEITQLHSAQILDTENHDTSYNDCCFKPLSLAGFFCLFVCFLTQKQITSTRESGFFKEGILCVVLTTFLYVWYYF